MNEIENTHTVNNSQQSEEGEIDLIELAQKIWVKRKLVLKTCGYALLTGLVVAFSIPKEYATSVTLAPEISGGRSDGGRALGGIGIDLGRNLSEDALSVDLYPDIVSSAPFLTDLFNIEVIDLEGKIVTTLYTYLKEEQRSTWWVTLFSFPFKVLNWGSFPI
ncbi:hypothetical protein EZS27_008949 [termite gut metagenome]|uniref:Polysaccharide chain length determinant N-terminal domain-containing protein n=1 Tax=termite gut metagenome TaxID=433724 RepID=A0A5J4SBT4_9ZZZZ